MPNGEIFLVAMLLIVGSASLSCKSRRGVQRKSINYRAKELVIRYLLYRPMDRTSSTAPHAKTLWQPQHWQVVSLSYLDIEFSSYIGMIMDFER